MNKFFIATLSGMLLLSACATHKPTPLIVEAAKQDVGIVEMLVGQGADVNDTDANGRTPLMQAIRANKADVVVYLLNKGANINAKDNAGRSPLSYVGSLGDGTGKELIPLLLDAGADPHSKGYTEDTLIKFWQWEVNYWTQYVANYAAQDDARNAVDRLYYVKRYNELIEAYKNECKKRGIVVQ